MKTRSSLIAVTMGGALIAAACGSTAPSEQLVDARRAYQSAAQTRAPQLVPAQMLEAQEALQAAEKAHEKDAGGSAEKHYAYLAQRKAELAVIESDRATANLVRQQATQTYSQLQNNQRVQAETDLQRTRMELAQTRNELANVMETSKKQELTEREKALEERQEELESELATKSEQLARERQLREEAERQAQEAMASLAEVAKVEQQGDQTVITLPGEVLFQTGQSDLSPLAQQKLQRVAQALKVQPEGEQIIVEGHTDSVGATGMNEALSFNRASSVRTYLIAEGIPADNVRAVGKGESEPIANNASPEGRANNRRVEIILRGP